MRKYISILIHTMDTLVRDEGSNASLYDQEGLLVRADVLDLFERLLSKGGPSQGDFARITEVSQKVFQYAPSHLHPLRQEIAQKVLNVCQNGELVGSLTGLSVTANPRGKYSVIAGIYSKKENYRNLQVNGSPLFRPSSAGEKFDDFFFFNPAAKALNGRNDYFNSKIKDVVEGSRSKIQLLNAASGPAIDLRRLYENLDDPEKLETVCVDSDDEAIEYAQKHLGDFSQFVTFVRKNIFAYRPDREFDIVWSAGLFDYLEEDESQNKHVFTRLLSKFHGWLKNEGKVIIGNFDTNNNPSRAYMEVFCLWYLYHRTDKELLDFARISGFNQAIIEKDPEVGVNSFLVAEKN